MIDLELEQQIIAMMINTPTCLVDGLTELKETDFYDEFMRHVFHTLGRMYTDNVPISMYSVAQEIGDVARGKGVNWLSPKEFIVGDSMFGYYVKKLKTLRKTRQLRELAEYLQAKIETGDDVDDLVDELESKVFSLSASVEQYKIISPKEHAERILDTISKRMDKKSNGGIKTSYVKLNRALNGGFTPGQLIILAAQTGRGKTAFAMNLMRDIAIVQKIPALYINTEMSDEQVDVRNAAILSGDLGITHTEIASGTLTGEQFNRLAGALDKMHRSGFHSVTINDLRINTLISTARKFKAKVDCKIIFVDYVGRMDTSDPKLTEWQVLKTIAKRLKTLAQQLQVTIVMLAQMTEGETLEGAKSMKNEADLFGYLRPMSDDEQAKLLRQYNYFLCIDKNRDGRTGAIPLKFIGDHMTFKGESADEVVRNQSEQNQDRSITEDSNKSSKSSYKRPTRSRGRQTNTWFDQ